MTVEPTHTSSKALCTPVYQLLSEKRSSHYALLSVVFNLLCISTNQKLFKKNLCNQNNHYKSYRQFLLWIETMMCLPQNQHFMVSKNEWDKKQDTGKSMKNALHAQQYGKTHPSSWSNVKQQKNQAHSLSHCQVMLVWRHQSVRQLVSKSIENSVK